MRERDALLAAVCDAPDDDLSRLVFADCCDDHGEPARAEFIRLQVRLAALDKGDPGRAALARREAELWAANGDAWNAETPKWAGVKTEAMFTRGWADRATCTAAAFARHGPKIICGCAGTSRACCPSLARACPARTGEADIFSPKARTTSGGVSSLLSNAARGSAKKPVTPREVGRKRGHDEQRLQRDLVRGPLVTTGHFLLACGGPVSRPRHRAPWFFRGPDEVAGPRHRRFG